MVQTRSPLVTRDIDLFKKIKRVQVNITVTTDNEDVRKAFEPYCPSNKVRLQAIKEINDKGIQSCITMTPLLPLADAESFAQALKETGIKRYIIQPFHKNKGRFVAGTREKALEMFQKYRWDNHAYNKAYDIIKAHIPDITIGKCGFAPPI